MKKFLTIIAVMITMSMAGQSQFAQGFQAGFQETAMGMLATPAIPIYSTCGVSYDPYKCGYERGVQLGVDMMAMAETTVENPNTHQRTGVGFFIGIIAVIAVAITLPVIVIWGS
ncbi:MAG: hypothetical protein OSA02_08145 [Schleiferiaceae bacterium]|jgi:hypothetical protein|nr:hypothetical protein [Schleiferiaceae bacterium]|tara:strand:+ start:944 stop:1285 length:342 start_codon:yes stop_codon:yes gene_type:complete